VTGRIGRPRRAPLLAATAIALAGCGSTPLPPYQLPQAQAATPPAMPTPAVVAAPPPASMTANANAATTEPVAPPPVIAVPIPAPAAAAPPPPPPPAPVVQAPTPAPIAVAPAAATAPSPAPAEPASYAQKILADGIHEYGLGLYAASVQSMHDALQQGLADPLDQANAHKYLALSYCATGIVRDCKDEFRRALVLNPGLTIEPGQQADPRIGPIFASAKLSR